MKRKVKALAASNEKIQMERGNNSVHRVWIVQVKCTASQDTPTRTTVTTVPKFHRVTNHPAAR